MKIYIFSIIALFINSFTIAAQTSENDFNTHENENVTQTVIAEFDEFDGEVFSFEYLDEDGNAAYLMFDDVSENILNQYDLKSDKYQGKVFEIVYTEDSQMESDDDGDLQEYIKTTITKLTLK